MQYRLSPSEMPDLLQQQPIPAAGNAEEKELTGTVDSASAWLCSSQLRDLSILFCCQDWPQDCDVCNPSARGQMQKSGHDLLLCLCLHPRQMPGSHGRRQPSPRQCQEDAECLSCLHQLALPRLQERPEAQVSWEWIQAAPTQFHSNHCILWVVDTF